MDSNRNRLADDFMGRGGSIEQPRGDMYRGGVNASRIDENFAENTGSSNRSRLEDDFMGHHVAGGREQQQRGDMYRGGSAASRIDESVGYNRNPDRRYVDNETEVVCRVFGST